MQAREGERAYLPAEAFGGMFESFERSTYRLETLDQYLVKEEEERLRRYLDGEPLPPDVDAPREWQQTLQGHRDAGRLMERVHILPEKLTPYLRQEIEWGYAYNWGYGERIHLAGPEVRNRLPEEARRDYWLFDDRTVVLMDYDDAGRFIGGRPLDDPEEVAVYRQAKEIALAAAVPLPEYLAAQRRA